MKIILSNKEQGFTMVELMVAMSLTAILSLGSWGFFTDDSATSSGRVTSVVVGEMLNYSDWVDTGLCFDLSTLSDSEANHQTSANTSFSIDSPEINNLISFMVTESELGQRIFEKWDTNGDDVLSREESARITPRDTLTVIRNFSNTGIPIHLKQGIDIEIGDDTHLLRIISQTLTRENLDLLRDKIDSND